MMMSDQVNRFALAAARPVRPDGHRLWPAAVGTARRRLVLLAVVALLAGPLSFGGARPALAADFAVTKVGDTKDGACDADCSLREAIVAANAASGADTITLPPGTYALTRGPAGDDTAAGGDLDVTAPLTIVGAGARRTTIDASAIPGGERAIDVIGAATSLSISGVTITGGGGTSGTGGGVRSAGPLTVTDATVRGNRAFSGGGIRSAVEVSVERSTISDNTTVSDGAGLLVVGTATIANSTISGNEITSQNNGSAIATGPATTVTVAHTTIANNRSADPTRAALATGVGSPIKLQDTVLSNAPTANCLGPAEQSAGHNLSSDASCNLDQASDQTGTDPKLGPLRNNGGPTDTHALLFGSPAIDAGSPTGCPPTDQRGATRPQDGDGVGAATCDIGAFEAEVDRTAPTVRVVVPAEDATDVAPGTNVSAFFSEPMRPNTITTNTVKLFAAGSTTAIGAAVSYDATAKRATLNPTANLLPGVRYKAVVTVATRDATGNQLDQDPGVAGNQPKVWFFTVRP